MFLFQISSRGWTPVLLLLTHSFLLLKCAWSEELWSTKRHETLIVGRSFSSLSVGGEIEGTEAS